MQFVDGNHALGHIYCLEEHFRRIAERLDSARIPREIGPGQKLTIEQRVELAVDILRNGIDHAYDFDDLLENAIEYVEENAPDLETDPEEILEKALERHSFMPVEDFDEISLPSRGTVTTGKAKVVRKERPPFVMDHD